MFRELTRKKQQLTDRECKEILKEELRGVLAVNGDGGYPYALPINFYFDEANNRIYFHGGKVGHKMDSIANSDKVSFCVYDKGHHKDGHWSLNIKSVILFGSIHIVNDWTDALMVEFCKRFTGDMEYIYSEIENFKSNTAVLCLEIEHMTGKLVNEAWQSFALPTDISVNIVKQKATKRSKKKIDKYKERTAEFALDAIAAYVK